MNMVFQSNDYGHENILIQLSVQLGPLSAISRRLPIAIGFKPRIIT